MTAPELRAWWEKATPRERDARIAELMEWDHSHQVIECDDHWYTRCIRCGAGRSDDKLKYVNDDADNGYVKDCTVPPAYTSPDWSGMGQVVEKMRKREYEFCLTCEMVAVLGGPWSAYFKKFDELRMPNPIYSMPTAPEAAGLAALLAVEVGTDA